MNVPKIIWILWFQGENSSPAIVKKCINSWKRLNPEWTVNILDDESIYEYLPDYQPHTKIHKTQQSDIVRLELLKKYGGVWTDATTLCNKPLDSWLPEVMDSDFFAYYLPGKDRLISSWFIATSKDNVLISKFLNAFNKYWLSFNINAKNLENKLLMRILTRLFNRNIHSTKHWFGFIPRKIFGVHPYFVFHYLFAYLVKKDKDCKDIWEKTPKISADGPHKIQQAGLYTQVTKELLTEITQDQAPLYKLTYKYDEQKCNENSLLNVILNKPSE